ncbi:MAG: hypothetical protein PHP20_10295 [Firmicutes bacterium]|nr:hypothetical protein [Bacillota bacterium]
MKARPALTMVIALMLMVVALMIPAGALCAPVLGYFGEGHYIKWGAETDRPYYDGSRWWRLPSIAGGTFEATLWVETRQDEKQIDYSFEVWTWLNPSEKIFEKRGTTAGTPGPFAEMRRDDPARGFIEIGKISVTVPKGHQVLQTSSSRVFLADPMFNGSRDVVALGSTSIYAGNTDKKTYWTIRDMYIPNPFGGKISFNAYMRVYAGDGVMDESLSIKYPPSAAQETTGLKAALADAVDNVLDDKNGGFAPIGKYTVDVPPGFRWMRFATKRDRIVISDLDFTPNSPVTVLPAAGATLVQCGGTPYQGKDTGKVYYRSDPLILPHAEGGILEMDWHAWLYPTDRLVDVPLSIVSQPLGPTLFTSSYKSPVQADLAELSHETDRWGFTPLIQHITVEVPKGSSILQMVGSDRSVFANIKFTSQAGTATEIVRASGDYIQGHLTRLPYFRAGSVYLPDKAGGTVSFNAFIQPGVSDTEREDFLEVIRPEKLDVPVAYGKVKPSDMLETHIDSPDYGFVYIGTMTVPVPEGQDRIEFRTKSNRVWISQLVYATAGEKIAPPKPPALVSLSAPKSHNAPLGSTPTGMQTAPTAPTSVTASAWGYESPAETQGTVLDIDTLNALIEEFTGAIARAEAAKSAHPAFIDHLNHILASLVAYRDALVANNADPAKPGGWGDY